MSFKDLAKGGKNWRAALKRAGRGIVANVKTLGDTQELKREIKKHAKTRILTKNIRFGRSFKKTARVGFIAGLVAPHAARIVEGDGFIPFILSEVLRAPEASHAAIVTGFLTALVAYGLELLKHQLKIRIKGIL